QLDLLGGGQERVPAGLAQEELQRVGRRLPRELQRLRLRLGGRRRGRLAVLVDVVDDVDLTRLELAVDGVRLERVEAQRLQDVVQLGLQDVAAFLRRLDQLTQVVAEQEDVRVRGHARDCLAVGRPSQTTISGSCSNAREQALWKVENGHGFGGLAL